MASAGLFAACALTRPEGLVLGLMALGILIAGRLGKFGKREIRWIVTFLLPVAAWFLWRFSFYGSWVPNTYYAKQAPVIDAFTKGVAYLARMFPSLLNDKPIFYALAAIWWLLIVVGMFSERFRRPPTLMVPLLVVGQMIFVLRAGGDWMGGWRYMCPVLPLIFLLTMTALVDIMEGCLRLRGSLGKVLAQGAIGIACLTLVLGSYWGHQDFWATPYIGYLSWSSKGFSFQQRKLLQGWMLQKAVTVSDWLNTHVPAGSVVAYSEMGATTYFSPQLRFLDVDGLTDHGVATLPGVKHEQIGVRDPYITMNGVVGPYLLHERKPDYILQGLGLRSGQSSAQFSILNDVYEFVDAFPTPPSDTPGVQVYMAVWKRRS